MSTTKGGRPKGLPKSGGRRKGTPNRITGELREMVLTALSELGGVEYLIQMGHDRPEVFVRLLARCMPQAVDVRSEYDDLPVVTFNFAGKPINGSVDEI
jgi:hypothetical protein